MIRKPWLLIASILGGQFVCVMVGVLWYAAWQETTWRNALRQHFLEYNVLLTAQHASKLSREFDLPADGPLSASQRAALQHYVESISLPKRSYICLIDETGQMVAHPRMRTAPQLARTRPGRWILRRAQGDEPLQDALAPAPEQAVSGSVAMPDGLHLVAARRVGRSRLVILSHQRAEALEPLAASIAAPVRRVGFGIAATLVILTGLITRIVMNRYESRLAVMNEQLERKVRERSQALLQTRDAVIFGLAKLADSRDHETGEHLERLQNLVCMLARQTRRSYPEIDEAWIERLRVASVLHDIGKVGVPDAVLLKRGPLSPDERRIMQRHAKIGADCLTAIGKRLGANDFLAMARDISWYHHERWDGGGYPHGLSGEGIPLAARVVALADMYDAARSRRIYKQARSHATVRQIIIENRGRHFDPAIVDAFLGVEQAFQRFSHTDRHDGPGPTAWPIADTKSTATRERAMRDTDPCDVPVATVLAAAPRQPRVEADGV